MANRAETPITLTDAPEHNESTVITDGLRAYTATQAGRWDACPLVILVRDPETRRVAAATGPHVPRPLDG